MMIVDTKLAELERAGKPIRVGLVGAGFAAAGFAHQLLTYQNGMRLVAIVNRTLENAHSVYQNLGIKPTVINSLQELSNAIKNKRPAITNNPQLLCTSTEIDVIVEATGEVEFGVSVVLSAIKHKKHVVLINAELDATLGPILKVYADRAGVVYTQADGDQPAVLMHLYREALFLGLKPVLLGNIKSLLDPYRTPQTQKAFAQAHFQRPKMITSFADGSKISFENASVANATGFKIGKRGMYGPRCSRVEEAYAKFDLQELLKNGLVDYILGAEPSFGVFVLGYSTDPVINRYLSVYKLGEGPLYTLYRPYHLSPLEAPLSVARAVLFKDAALAPIKPMCGVIALAKRDLRVGEVLDGIGGFMVYGVIENYPAAQSQNLLPMGLTDGCKLKRAITKDTPITYADVELPTNRLADRLYLEQTNYFKP